MTELLHSLQNGLRLAEVECAIDWLQLTSRYAILTGRVHNIRKDLQLMIHNCPISVTAKIEIAMVCQVNWSGNNLRLMVVALVIVTNKMSGHY